MVVSLSTYYQPYCFIPTVAVLLNRTSLDGPGGPLPPAEMFVQFKTVDQLLEPVQRSVPGTATMFVTNNVTMLVLARLPLLAVNASG